MKTIQSFCILALLLLMAACGKEATDTAMQTRTPVSISVSDFSVSVEDFAPTRSETAVANYTGVGAMTLAFYDAEGNEQYKYTQYRSNTDTYTTFGQFACDLPFGTYTLVVIGYGYFDGDVFTLDSPASAAFTGSFARETFTATQSVTVSNTTPINLSVTLKRIVARLSIASTDGRSASVHKFRTTYSAGSKSFSPTSGAATDNEGFSIVNNISSGTVGNKVTLVSYVFLTSNDQTMNITIEALDASDNVVFSKVVSNVPFKRNRVTKLQGPLFSSSASASFSVETDWQTEETVNF